MSIKAIGSQVTLLITDHITTKFDGYHSYHKVRVVITIMHTS